MSGAMFLKPERPFLVHYEDANGNGGWSWLETEEELREVVKEHKAHGLMICDVVEVGSIREIQIEDLESL